MSRIIKPLSDKQIREAKASHQVRQLRDGKNLVLIIRPSGKKLWRHEYVKPIRRTRSSITLGDYPAISLKEARQLCEQQRALLAKGIDLKTHRDAQRRAAQRAHANTLKCVAQQWFKVKSASVSPAHATSIWRSLELHVFKQLGNVPISQINAPDSIATLRRLEASGAKEQVRRVIQRLNDIMTYALNVGLIETNPLVGISQAFMPPIKQHLASLPPAQLHCVFEALQRSNIETITYLLIEFQLHTMVRPGEAVQARWQDIDFQQKLWTIPAEFMKAKREHKVPLSEACMALLKHAQASTGHREFVFSNSRNPRRHIHAQTANSALKRAGLAGVLVAHGFRSMASTALNEAGFRFDVIECALAHRDKNQIRAAYNRSIYLDERRMLMQWWSNFILAAQAQAHCAPRPWQQTMASTPPFTLNALTPTPNGVDYAKPSPTHPERCSNAPTN